MNFRRAISAENFNRSVELVKSFSRRVRYRTEMLTFDFALTAKRLRLKAQGCRFGYPGLGDLMEGSTATRLRPGGATRSGLIVIGFITEG